MNNPHISIIIPIYNSEKYISECVDSIINQSYKDFELILVNDGSSDKSGLLCEQIALSDHRIKIYHKENGGAASARKYGVEKAKGEWILFSDSDDIMPNGAIEDLISKDNGNCELILGTILYKRQRLFIYTENFETSINKSEYIKCLLDRKTYYGPCSKLYKRSLFDNIIWDTDKEIFQNEDLLMLITLTTKIQNPIIVSNNYVHYHCIEKEDSISTKQMSLTGWSRLFYKIREELELTNNFNEDIKTAYFNYIIWSLYTFILANGYFTNDKILLNEIRILQNESSVYPENKLNSIYILSKRKQVYYVCKRKTRLFLSKFKKRIIKTFFNLLIKSGFLSNENSPYFNI